MDGGLRVSGSKATNRFQLTDELSQLVARAEAKSGEIAAMIAAAEIATKVCDPDPMYMRVRARFMSEREFLFFHGSGTLRKNGRVGFDYKKQYLHERVAFDFGYGFEAIHESHINWGSPMSEGDCHSVTEAGWHIDRYQFIAFPGDEFEAKYLKIHTGNGPDREGIGIIIRKTSAPYLPANFVVFSIIAEVDLAKHDYKEALNPC